MSDTANVSQTPALAGSDRPTAVEKPSPWNTPAVQPPSCSTSLTDDSGEPNPECLKQPFPCLI